MIGFGRIGRQVGHLAHAFGMSVLAHTRSPVDPPGYEPFDWADLTTLVRHADVISLNCPADRRKRGAWSIRNFLPNANRTAMLINASRGPLVVESGSGGGAESAGNWRPLRWTSCRLEPITADNPLLQARNCFLTPHQAWATLEARQRLMQVTVDNVASFLRGDARQRRQLRHLDPRLRRASSRSSPSRYQGNGPNGSVRRR